MALAEAMSCDHYNHAHADDSHGADTSTTDGRRRVALAGLLTFGFMGAEIAGGIISGSLALIADAGHMATDAASLALAWFGYRLAARPMDNKRTFGFGRYRILAAFVNGLALIALAIWILVEAAGRLMSPQPIMAPLMLGVAALGLIVNLICFWVLHGGDQEDLNLRGAVLHVLGDLLGSVAAIGAALIIMATGWTPIDPILSALVAVLIIVAGWRITRRAGTILAEEAPPHLCADTIRRQLSSAVEGIVSLPVVRVWSTTEAEHHVIVHVVPKADAPPERLRQALRAELEHLFRQNHITIEIAAQP